MNKPYSAVVAVHFDVATYDRLQLTEHAPLPNLLDELEKVLTEWAKRQGVALSEPVIELVAHER